MFINEGRGFLHTFIKVFIVMFTILVLLPYIVDQIMNLFSGGMAPGNNSIIVFKDFVDEQAVISKLLLILKKIIMFM
jgi:hypothetical protein